MKTFVRHFATLAVGNLAGKVVAILREVIFAAAFGTGTVATGFKAAQSAAVIPANLVSGDLLSAAFAPTYARLIESDPRRAAHMLSGYIVWLGVVLSAVAGIVGLSSGLLLRLLIPGASESAQEHGTLFLAILAWCIPLFGVSGVMSYALGANGRYLSTSLRPLLQSVGMITGVGVALLTGTPAWLAVAFAAAWILYTLWSLSLLLRHGHLQGTTPRGMLTGWTYVRDGARIVAPLLALPFALQGAIVLERVISSFGADGLVAAVDYAKTISDSLYSLVAVPLGVLGLTQLSKLGRADFDRMMGRISDAVLILCLPGTFLLASLSEPLVAVVFGRGAFDEESQAITSQVLFGLAVGLAFQVLGYTMTRALSAQGKNRHVLISMLAALVAQVLVQLASLGPLGPVAIGLGVSAYGLVLTVYCAAVLGLGRALSSLALSFGGAIAVSTWLLLVHPFGSAWLEAAAIALVWGANLVAVPRSRRFAGELGRLLSRAVRR